MGGTLVPAAARAVPRPVRTGRASYQGRLRRRGTDLVHQRPENRQRGGSVSPEAATGRGHATSTAATMAATSSSVASPPRETTTSAPAVAPVGGVVVMRLQRHVAVLALGQLFALGAQH